MLIVGIGTLLAASSAQAKPSPPSADPSNAIDGNAEFGMIRTMLQGMDATNEQLCNANTMLARNKEYCALNEDISGQLNYLLAYKCDEQMVGETFRGINKNVREFDEKKKAELKAKLLVAQQQNGMNKADTIQAKVNGWMVANNAANGGNDLSALETKLRAYLKELDEQRQQLVEKEQNKLTKEGSWLKKQTMGRERGRHSAGVPAELLIALDEQPDLLALAYEVTLVMDVFKRVVVTKQAGACSAAIAAPFAPITTDKAEAETKSATDENKLAAPKVHAEKVNAEDPLGYLDAYAADVIDNMSAQEFAINWAKITFVINPLVSIVNMIDSVVCSCCDLPRCLENGCKLAWGITCLPLNFLRCTGHTIKKYRAAKKTNKEVDDGKAHQPSNQVDERQ